MKSNLFNILFKELQEVFRDKKSLMMMLTIPFMIPLVVFGLSALFGSYEDKDIKAFNKIGVTYELSENEKILAKNMKIDLIEGSLKELENAFDDSKVNAFVTKEAKHYKIHFDDTENSTYALELTKEYFNQLKIMLQKEELISSGLEIENILNPITVENVLLTKESFMSKFMINYIFGFILMAMTISATYPATDATAGEKERGTLETLLSFPVRSKDVIFGKYLSVSISSIITGLISLAFALISITIANDNFKLYAETKINFGVASIFFTILAIVLYALMLSGIFLIIASKAKSFKEAQSALSPFTMIIIFPAMATTMLNLKTNAIIALIPFLNVSQIFSDIVNGQSEFIYILLFVISSLTVITILLAINFKFYKGEKVLFSE